MFLWDWISGMLNYLGYFTQHESFLLLLKTKYETKLFLRVI